VGLPGFWAALVLAPRATYPAGSSPPRRAARWRWHGLQVQGDRRHPV